MTYSNEAKISSLGVPSGLIAERRGQRAGGQSGSARARSSAVFAATTGIATRPAEHGKPVGTAFLGLAGGGETSVRHLFFPTDRETFKQLVTQTALNLLRSGWLTPNEAR